MSVLTFAALGLAVLISDPVADRLLTDGASGQGPVADGLLSQSAPGSPCTSEPASQWAPAGYVCPPEYGIGTASTWPGPGAARNDCTYPWECDPVSVRSLDTGRRIVVTPVTWCHCWTGVTGPNGETRRIIDLDPGMVRALGLDPELGLWAVEVLPVGTMPDSAMPALMIRVDLPEKCWPEAFQSASGTLQIGGRRS